MTIITSNEGNTHIMTIEGWLDTKTAPELEEQIDKIPDSAEELVLDLAGLEYISSAGIRQFVAAYKKMGGSFKLRNVRQEIQDVMKLTGLTGKFTFE